MLDRLASVLLTAEPVPAHSSMLGNPWLDVLGSLGGVVLAFIQLVVGLGLASYAITRGMRLQSSLLGGLDFWGEVKKRNMAVALLAVGVVISYCLIISGGVKAITSSIIVLGSSPLDGLQALLAGVINLTVAVAVAPFAVTVVIKVMDRLTKALDERAELAAGNTAVGAVYCGILIGVAELVASGVGGIGASLTGLFIQLRRALLG
jgi:uncharacterized membrane protein YjfL (UPF0719 family)